MPDHSEEHDNLTLHEVADTLGVHYMTVYRYVRLGMLPASRNGRSWLVAASDLAAFTEHQETQPSGRGSAPWDERLANRMLAADDAGAWSVVQAAMTSGLSPVDVHTSMLTPALRSVGDLWESGEIDVAQEHAASQVAARIIARLGPQMSHRGLRRGTIIVGSTQTEQHSLPIAILADLLRAQRFDVIDLGANLPPESFAAAVGRADDLVAVAIGVTTTGQDRAIRDTVNAIADVSEVPIIVGGSAVPVDLDDSLPIAAVTTSGQDAIDAVEDIVAAR